MTVEQRAEVARIAADQWGLLTAAQAVKAGVSRMLLSRMAASGELQRVVQGVYATPSAEADRLVETRALWLALDPERTAEERLRQRHLSGVLSHTTAASLHEIGDLLDAHVEVTLPRRHQTRREQLRIHVAELEPADVTTVAGLPVTTAARTVADLVVTSHDHDHVAAVLADAMRRGLTDRADVATALKRRLGEQADDVLAELLNTAGLDEATLTRQVAESPIGQALIATTAERIMRSLHADQDFSRTVASIAAALAPTPDFGLAFLQKSWAPQRSTFSPIPPELIAQFRQTAKLPPQTQSLVETAIKALQASMCAPSSAVTDSTEQPRPDVDAQGDEREETERT